MKVGRVGRDIEENGLPPFEMVSWYAVWGPKGLDAGALSYLGKHIADVAGSAAFKNEPYGTC